MNDEYSLQELQEYIKAFTEDDRNSTNKYNDLVSWNGNSIERQVSFLSWRLGRALNLVVYLAQWIEKNHTKP